MLITGPSSTENYKDYDDYNNSEACSGYDAYKNITVLGGIWESTEANLSCIVRIFHATNITLDGLTFTGGGCVHQLEVAAIDGFMSETAHLKTTANVLTIPKTLKKKKPYSSICHTVNWYIPALIRTEPL